MQVHLTDSFIKIAASWDDQANLVNRDVNPGGISQTVFRGTESKDQILERWNRRKKRKPTEIVRIYQMGLVDEATLKEQQKSMINL